KQLPSHRPPSSARPWATSPRTLAPSREAWKNLTGTLETRDSRSIRRYGPPRFAKALPESAPVLVSVFATPQTVLYLSPNSSLPFWFLLAETIAIVPSRITHACRKDTENLLQFVHRPVRNRLASHTGSVNRRRKSFDSGYAHTSLSD